MASNQVSNQRHSVTANQRSQATKRPSENVGGDDEPDFGSLGNIKAQASTYWAQGEDQMRECVRGHRRRRDAHRVGCRLGRWPDDWGRLGPFAYSTTQLARPPHG